eukprot:gene13109-19999_t
MTARFGPDEMRLVKRMGERKLETYTNAYCALVDECGTDEKILTHSPQEEYYTLMEGKFPNPDDKDAWDSVRLQDAMLSRKLRDMMHGQGK